MWASGVLIAFGWLFLVHLSAAPYVFWWSEGIMNNFGGGVLSVAACALATLLLNMVAGFFGICIVLSLLGW